jgi:L-histidine N-alpha-methyltransferase
MDMQLPIKRFHIQELSAQDSFELLRNDVQAGLYKAPRSLPAKYFYDDEGSRLFDAICKTQDYYPTRTESALLNKHAEQIIDVVKAKTCIELGAGTSVKTEILLSKLLSQNGADDFTYISIDVCDGVLIESAQRLLKKFNNLRIESIVGEYIPAVQAVQKLVGPALFAFIGSSIGNFTEQESIELLSKVASKMGLNDYFLLGIDRVKDIDVLERAYDDSQGVTAEFNLNVLKVLNYKLQANFDLNKFSHLAMYNEQLQQIEMYLVSKETQDIRFALLQKTISLKTGEKILTEISRKYTRTSIRRLLEKSGLKEIMHFEPSNEYFSLVLAKRQQ